MNKMNLTLCLITLAAIALFGCGASKQQKPIQAAKSGSEKTSGDADANLACTKDECPKITYNLGYGGESQDGYYIGYLNQDVGWIFSAGVKSGDETAASGEVRPPGLFVDESTLPGGATVVNEGGGLPSQLQISWTPSSLQTSNKDLRIYVRDVKYCEQQESKKICARTKYLKKYDQEFEQPWKILDPQTAQNMNQASQGGNVVNVANPNCGQNATTDGELGMKGLGAIMKFGGAILGGGGAGSIVKILMDPSVTGAITGGGQNQAQQVNCLR